MLNYPIPTNKKEIKSFLRLIGYYYKFIKDFAQVTQPLTKCLIKNVKISTSDPIYLEAFQLCKDLLINAPLLQYPDFDKEFNLTTYASNVTIGAILSQRK